MAGYDPYDRDYGRRYVREEREPRFLDARDYAKAYPSRELVARAREDSDLSIEEIRCEFPPPTVCDARRARSAEPGYYEAECDDHRGHGAHYHDYREYDRHGRRLYYEDQRRNHKYKASSISKQDKLIAAIAGAALLVGGKELYDRHEAKVDGVDVQRNPLSSAALAGFGALAGYQGAEFYSKQQARKDQTATYILH